MAGPPPGIYDSFSEQGLFWLPEYREDEVPGTLHYDPQKGAVLELLGIFGEVRNDKAVIHGVTTKGKPISLLDALDTNRQLNIPGIAHETWESNLLVIIAHITSADDETIFPKSYFRFDETET